MGGGAGHADRAARPEQAAGRVDVAGGQQQAADVEGGAIADDDAGGAPKRASGLGASPLVQPSPPVRPALSPVSAARPTPAAPASSRPALMTPPETEPEHEPEPLALSPMQIMGDDEADEVSDFSAMMQTVESDTSEAAAEASGFAAADLVVSKTTGSSGLGDGASVELSERAGSAVWEIRAGMISDQKKLEYLQGYVRTLTGQTATTP